MIPYNSHVVFTTPENKNYIKKLKPDEDWQSHNGNLKAESVHQVNPGEYVLTSSGVPILVKEATLPDILMGLKRQTQIIFPKDIALICMKLGIGPGKIVGEA